MLTRPGFRRSGRLCAVARPGARGHGSHARDNRNPAYLVSTDSRTDSPKVIRLSFGIPYWRFLGPGVSQFGVGVTDVVPWACFLSSRARMSAMPVPGGRRRGRLFHDHGSLPANNAVNDP
jgi:hypothetical protein